MANRYPYATPPTRPGVEQQNVPGFSSVNVWPHQSQPNAAICQQQQLQLAEKQRQKEYLKQQQKLRLMAGTSNKPVSADKLIENLLDTKDTFRLKVNAQQNSTPVASHPKTPVGLHLSQQSSIVHGAQHIHYSQAYHTLPALQTTTPVTGVGDVAGNFSARTVQETCSSSSAMNFQLPSWLIPHSPALPALYIRVWSIVGIDNGLVDTNKIFPLLLTSGLPTDVLGYIWSIANKKIAGQLTETELYIVLALVGLAQNGCTFNNISVLNLIPQAPIPNLNLSSFEVATVGVEPSTSSVSATQRVQLLQSIKSTSTVLSGTTQELEVSEEMSFQGFNEKSDSNPSTSSTQVPEEEIDDFSDFQSAVVSEEQKSSIHDKDHSSSPPTVAFQGVSSTDGIKSFTSIFSLSSGNRGIGSRLANHSLGAPRQVKSRHHKHHNHHHHHHYHHRNSQPTAHQNANVDVQSSLSLRDEPSTIPAGDEDEFSDFQQAKEESQSRVNSSDLFQRCPTSNPYLLKESAIRSEKQNTMLFDSPVHVKLKSDVERKEISTSTDSSLAVTPEICEVAPKVQNVAPPVSGPELLTVEDDKYSALRALSAADQTSQDTKELSDDFGDFLSAEPVSADDSFVALAVRDVNLRPGEMPLENSSIWPSCPEGSSQSVEFQVDDWGAFETAADTNTLHKTNTIPSNNLKTDVSESGILSLVSDLDGLDLKNSSGDFKQDTSNTGHHVFLDKSRSTMDNVVDLSAGNLSSCVYNVESGEELSHSQSNFKGYNGLTFLGKIYTDHNQTVNNPNNDLFVLEINPVQSESGSFVMNATDDDEFGDFIGPEAWSEDGKFPAKESSFEDPSMLRIKDTMCDSQSVSSLELPVLSRHGSLPSLDLKIFPSTSDKTGIHHSWDSSPQIDSSLHGTVVHRSTNQEGIDLQIKEWCRCLQSCLQLLQAALATFTNILNDSVLEEVVKSHDGKEYLLNLLEVYGICKRVKQSSNGVCSDSKLDSILAEVDMIWCSMEQYFFKADIKVTEMDFGCSAADVNQEHTPCGICLTSVGSDILEENPNNIYPLEYSGQVYHASCANLWVNCVDCRLPALASTGSLL